MQGYSSVEEWVDDVREMKKNNNDKVLASKITIRLKNTIKKIQDEIIEQSDDIALEFNPKLIIAKIIKENPNYVVIFNNEDDIWFYV